MSGTSQNLFMQNKMNFKNAGMVQFQGEYEYDIDLPKKEEQQPNSNQGSVIGHYQDINPSKDNFMKKSMMKLWIGIGKNK